MKIYSQHKCSRNHRTYRALAQCMYPRAIHVLGEGSFATISRCTSNWEVTVELHATLAEAEQAKNVIDSSGCGGGCHGKSRHEIVQLQKA